MPANSAAGSVAKQRTDCRLMLARVLSTTIDLGVIANGDLGALISSLFASYCQLLVMAAPMLVIIITTANVGPQHGLKRIAALAAAVLLSTILGAVLRIVFIIEWFGGIDDPVGVLAYVVPRYAILGAMLTAV